VDDPDGTEIDTVENVEDADAPPVADADSSAIDTPGSRPEVATLTDAEPANETIDTVANALLTDAVPVADPDGVDA